MVSLPEQVAGRLRTIRKRQNMTLEQVAAGAGTTLAQIHKLERSQRPLTLEWIERLSKALGVPPVQLMTDAPGHHLVMIPVVGRISAGNWKEAVEQADIYITPPGVPAHAFALQADGDSMDLLVADGGYVIIDPNLADLRDGKVYAVMSGDGETTLKKYRADPARLEPCSSNPAHTTISLGREPFTVIGQAIGSYSPL